MNLLKHKNNRDVAIEVIEREPDGTTMVMWWNIGPHKPWCMNIIQTFTISAEAWKDWEPYPYSPIGNLFG